jgi:hypothetical protein
MSLMNSQQKQIRRHQPPATQFEVHWEQKQRFEARIHPTDFRGQLRLVNRP